jgi:lipopolysaccharide/colanic/teichoic acid biosynthesis glycosyltransferase
MYRYFLKRFFDIVLSLIGIIILALPMLIIALIIKIDSRGPVLFKQKRLGRHGKVFHIYKFRSMCVGAEKMGTGVYSEKGDSRVTRVGRFLRATSLDEIPQFFNILLGHMSFIGPRPPLTYHPWPIEEYTDEQLKMFSVRPGVTGWAQINGRKAVEWNRRIELNVYYVEHLSFLFDMRIIFSTVFKVLRNEDNENHGATVIKDNNKDTSAGGEVKEEIKSEAE